MTPVPSRALRVTLADHTELDVNRDGRTPVFIGLNNPSEELKKELVRHFGSKTVDNDDELARLVLPRLRIVDSTERTPQFRAGDFVVVKLVVGDRKVTLLTQRIIGLFRS